MLWHDHCNMFSQHASSHIDTIKGWLWWELMGFTLINDCPIYHTAMSTVTIMFYITTCTYLSYNWKLVLFDYFPKFLLPQPNPLWKPHIWFLLLCFFLFVCFVFKDSIYKWDHTVVSLSHIYHSAQCLQGPSMLLKRARFLLFYGWIYIVEYYISHNFFIHSSTDGPWHCFQALKPFRTMSHT